MRCVFICILFLLSSCQSSSNQASSRYPVKKCTIAQSQQKTEHVQTALSSPPSHPLAVICLDAGHGGSNLGTRRKRAPFLCEKVLALDLVKTIQRSLKGYRVILTRENDRFISLPDRVFFAQKKKAELFVSIHFNWAKNNACRGVEIFFYDKKNDARSVLSKKAAEACLKAILARTNLPSRGVKSGNFHVIRETSMPAVLIEGGFFSNGEDVLFLKKKINRERLAEAIADGIREFCAKKRPN